MGQNCHWPTEKQGPVQERVLRAQDGAGLEGVQDPEPQQQGAVSEQTGRGAQGGSARSSARVECGVRS